MTFPRLLCLSVLVVSVVANPTAFAQDAKAVKMVEELNHAAMEEYDILNFEGAKKQLLDAVALVKKNGLDRHSVAARTHVNLGIVYGGGLSDANTAVHEFQSAVEIFPTVKLEPAYKTPELNKLLDQARAQVASGAKGRTGTLGGGPRDAPDAGAERGSRKTAESDGEDTERVVGLKHTSIDESKSGAPIRITAKVGPDVHAKQVALYYRAQGEENFKPVSMKNVGGVKYEAEIPAEATTGETVHYYIEARNAAGKVAASKGSPGSPNVVSIILVQGEADDEQLDDENPLLKDREAKKKADDDDAEPAVRKRHQSPSNAPRMFVAVGLGTGGALVSGRTETKHQTFGCCTAPEALHFVLPEIGLFVTPQLATSVYFRLGLPLFATVPGAAPVGPAALFRLSYWFTQAADGLMVHGDLGGGILRQTVSFAGTGDVDNHAMGPVLVGGGLGYMRPLSGVFRFTADVNALLGIEVKDKLFCSADGKVCSDPEPGMNFDVSVGIAMVF